MAQRATRTRRDADPTPIAVRAQTGTRRGSARSTQVGAPDRMTHAALRVSLVVLVVAAVAYLGLLLRDVIFMGFVSLILAAGLVAPVRGLESRGVPRVPSLIVVCVAVLAVALVVLWAIVPPLIDQLGQLVEELPILVASILEFIRPLSVAVGAPTDVNALFDLIVAESGTIAGVVGGVAAVPMVLLSVLFWVPTVFFMSFLILYERHRARVWLLRFFPPDHHPEVDTLISKSVDRLGAFVRGQLVIMTVVGVTAAVGLTLLDVPFALPLGLFAFLTEMIPIAGPFISGVPIVAIAFLESPVQGLIALAGFVVIHQVEGYVLIPLVQGKVIEISPLVALFAVIAGAALSGVLGALMAIPLVAIATVVVEDVVVPWRQRQFPAARPTR
jgi:predicted PurR-regulated permease PerM